MRVITGRTNMSAPNTFRARSCPSTPNNQSERPIFSPIAARAQSRESSQVLPDVEHMSVKELKTLVGKDLTPETEFKDLSLDSNAVQTRVYQLGFQDGMKTAQLSNPRRQPYSGLETSRSARVRSKQIKAQELKAQKIQKRNEDHLAKFIKRNEDQMWEFVPTLYHTQRDERHHLTADEWMTDKVKGYCNVAYGGDLSAMLHSFENKEVVEKLSGSHNMRRILLPTVRMDVPESQKKKSEVYGCGYTTNRRNHEATLTRVYQQSLPEYMMSTNGGFASTEHRRIKESANGPPVCLPGRDGRTNLTGWADVNTREGIDTKPPFLRGSAFSQAHEHF
jgi:hypothetical protein